ncbi:putative fungal pheromone GPCR, STE3-type [Cristinia sonorae]|uniref:Fungal pheromone GPCR, STE3-type n=1 Tax=Cristinia sonorae TaxID=1940300 RepID=A0A8K0UQW7_9AGAR|nr:putative fungal pheromone GPCR, STE3-type [Cristinia sonorae]
MTVTGLPFGAFLAALLVLIPLPGHWRARNIPTLSIIAWLFVINVTHGINTIAWSDNFDMKLAVWCDIVIRLDAGANLALPAACFCLCMHLERVASVRLVGTNALDKRRRMIIDLVVCLGLPIIYMALFYIVQGHRFDIVEGFGCHAATYVSIPEFFIVWFLPIVFALGTLVFSALAFLHFFRRRATFATHLASSSAGLTPGRYFRLMSMSIVLMFWSLLIISCNLYFNYRPGLRPWTNWADVHSNFSRVSRFPTKFIPEDSLRWTYFLWWTTPISAYIFVLFFAFGQDALREYWACVQWISTNVLRRKPQGMSQLGSLLPISSPPPSYDQKDSKTFTHKSSQTKLLASPSSTTHYDSKFSITATSPSDTHSFSDSMSYHYERRLDIPQDVSASMDSTFTRLSPISISQSSLFTCIPPPTPPAPARLFDDDRLSRYSTVTTHAI